MRQLPLPWGVPGLSRNGISSFGIGAVDRLTNSGRYVKSEPAHIRAVNDFTRSAPSARESRKLIQSHRPAQIRGFKNRYFG